MTVEQIHVQGLDALSLATSLLQRMRLADPLAGVWEAADIQWWWRSPRESDEAEHVFWVDEHGPIAGVYLSSWAKGKWQVDPIIVPGVTSVPSHEVWKSALETGERYAPGGFEIPINDNESTFGMLAQESGLTAGDSDWTGWMNATDVPELAPLADGFTIVDRTQRPAQPHPMQGRNGSDIAERLSQVSLYDPWLDLAVETDEGRSAAYILFWLDPVTKVGMIEPVRTEDEFQRKGLARALITVGMNRLVEKGATRLKVSWESEEAGALYHKVGFQIQSTTTWFRVEGTR